MHKQLNYFTATAAGWTVLSGHSVVKAMIPLIRAALVGSDVIKDRANLLGYMFEHLTLAAAYAFLATACLILGRKWPRRETSA